MSKEFEGQSMAESNRWVPPRIIEWDPIPWWVIPTDKLEQIVVVQLDAKINTMQNELDKMNQIREIVAGKCK